MASNRQGTSELKFLRVGRHAVSRRTGKAPKAPREIQNACPRHPLQCGWQAPDLPPGTPDKTVRYRPGAPLGYPMVALASVFIVHNYPQGEHRNILVFCDRWSTIGEKIGVKKRTTMSMAAVFWKAQFGAILIRRKTCLLSKAGKGPTNKCGGEYKALIGVADGT